MKRLPKNDEDVDTYITALRKMTANCKFKNFSELLIRDQFISQSSDRAIRQKLLSLENPSLEESICIANSIEISQASVKELESKSGEVVTPVRLTNYKKKKRYSTDQFFQKN